MVTVEFAAYEEEGVGMGGYKLVHVGRDIEINGVITVGRTGGFGGVGAGRAQTEMEFFMQTATPPPGCGSEPLIWGWERERGIGDAVVGSNLLTRYSQV